MMWQFLLPKFYIDACCLDAVLILGLIFSLQMFFFANKDVSVDEAEFWEKSYLLRLLQYSKLDDDYFTISPACDSMPVTCDRKEMGSKDSVPFSGTVKGKEHSIRNLHACPLFMKYLAKSIVSAGKSLQLMRHVPMISLAEYSKGSDYEFESTRDVDRNLYGSHSISGLTLSEVFCVSLVGLVGDGDHICKYFLQDDWYKYDVVPSFASCTNELDTENGSSENSPLLPYSEKFWYKFLFDTLSQKKSAVSNLKQKNRNVNLKKDRGEARDLEHEMILWRSCIENPVITPCRTILEKNRATWETLNLSRNFYLPALNDEILRKAVFDGDTKGFSDSEGTNYTFGFQFGESEYLRSQDEKKLLEMLFPFPTLLPSFQVLLFPTYSGQLYK